MAYLYGNSKNAEAKLIDLDSLPIAENIILSTVEKSSELPLAIRLYGECWFKIS